MVGGRPDAAVVAFDKKTGKVLWRSLDDKINHSSPAVVAIGGSRHLAILTAQHAIGLSLTDGQELWRYPMRAVNIATPVWGPGNQLFLSAAYGYGCQLLKLSPDGGGVSVERVYKNSVLATHHATGVLFEGHLYGFHDRRGSLKCVKFETGEEVWSTRETGKCKLIVADGQLIIVNESGYLYLAPASPDGFRYSAMARLTRARCMTAPSLADGRLYVRSDRELLCLKFKE